MVFLSYPYLHDVVSVRHHFQFYLIINFIFHFRPIQLGCFPIFYLLGLQSSNNDEKFSSVSMYISISMYFANNKIFGCMYKI
jgi:hypothetical protein